MGRAKGFAVGVILVLTMAPSSLAAGGKVSWSDAGSPEADQIEAATVALQDAVDAAGGLGIYKDGTGWVVAKPASGAPQLTAGSLSTFGIPVSVDVKKVDKATVDQVIADLESMHGKVDGDFGFGYDPATGKVILQSSADESAFSAIEKAYPGLIDFHRGEFGLAANWTNDAPPHWGGAWIQGGGWACTSGYTIVDQYGNKYMTTAGHCFEDNTMTNMGQVLRTTNNHPYPYYDVEIVFGHTYAGYVYDTSSTGRKVKNGTNPGVGNMYCVTGRAEGFQCNWTVQRLNETICYTNEPFCYHGLAGMTRPGGAPVQGGDSGGPLWYKYSDFTAGVRGNVSGYFWDVGTFSWYSWVSQYLTVANYESWHALTTP